MGRSTASHVYQRSRVGRLKPAQVTDNYNAIALLGGGQAFEGIIMTNPNHSLNQNSPSLDCADSQKQSGTSLPPSNCEPFETVGSVANRIIGKLVRNEAA